MARDDKLKILKQLSRSQSDKASLALKNEFQKAAVILTESTDYHQLESVLEELTVYGHRVADHLIPTLSKFLEKLRGPVFINSVTEYDPTSPVEAQTYLTKETLELVQLFRYFDTPAVVDIFIRYCEDTDETVVRAALEALRKCASYDIQVFYGGEGRPGLGASPQLEILAYLEKNQTEFMHGHIEAVQCLCEELLSPSLEGTSWDYKSVTWSSRALPVCDQTIDVRNRTVNFLKSIYHADRSISEKISLIRLMMASMDVPSRGECGDDLKEVIVENGLDVLDWIKGKIPEERFPVLQKTEHDVYWRYYHGISDAIRQSCLEIRDTLYENPEYQIYRVLIGFESVFEDWEESLSTETDFAKVEGERQQNSSEFAHEVSEENWATWKERILEFCKTESTDLATFPIFFGFLRELAELKPNLAFELVGNHLEQVEKFTIPIYRGLLQTTYRNDCQTLLKQRADEGLELEAIAKLFLGDQQLDIELLEIVLEQAFANKNEYILSLLLEVGSHIYESDPGVAVDRLFVPVLRRLTDLQSKDWVKFIWDVRRLQKITEELPEDKLMVLIEALLCVQRIDNTAEELLKPVAELRPDLVLDFFRQRIISEECLDDCEAIPFDFHELIEPLSKNAKLIVSTVRSWYDEKDVLFQFRGGRLIANVYPNFGEELERELIALVRTGEKSHAKFSLDILKNYHGQPFLHNVCREVVATHSSDEKLMSDVFSVLTSTGVVSGEFGIADAYARKAVELQDWLYNEDLNVREFAERHIESLKVAEVHERERAQESLELRKHQYGANDE
jgi:hypothetical protein